VLAQEALILPTNSRTVTVHPLPISAPSQTPTALPSACSGVHSELCTEHFAFSSLNPAPRALTQ